MANRLNCPSGTPPRPRAIISLDTTAVNLTNPWIVEGHEGLAMPGPASWIPGVGLRGPQAEGLQQFHILLKLTVLGPVGRSYLSLLTLPPHRVKQLKSLTEIVC